jgi:hypothetical protein
VAVAASCSETAHQTTSTIFAEVAAGFLVAVEVSWPETACQTTSTTFAEVAAGFLAAVAALSETACQTTCTTFAEVAAVRDRNPKMGFRPLHIRAYELAEYDLGSFAGSVQEWVVEKNMHYC